MVARDLKAIRVRDGQEELATELCEEASNQQSRITWWPAGISGVSLNRLAKARVSLPPDLIPELF